MTLAATATEIPGLLSFIPLVSPEFKSPYHQADWCEQIEGCLTGGVRALNSKPIRHHKTETTIHGIAWLLVKDPTIRILYMVADHEIATDRGKRIRQVCQSTDAALGTNIGPERGQNVIASWRNAEGGGVQVMSAAQSKLGQDVDVLIFDDPMSEEDSRDLAARDAVDRAIIHYTARAGRTGRRGSVLGVMSRWHPDDPVGRRLTRTAVAWDYRHSSAIIVDDDGKERAFAPDVMDLAELNRRRAELKETDVTERLWEAQFQNNPLPDSLGLFKNPRRYTELPAGSFRTVFGLDLAYSATGDYFALVVLKVFAESWVDNGVMTHGERGYVVAVWRERWDPSVVHDTIRIARGIYPGATMFSYMSGPEIGIAHYLAERGMAINVMPARYSKRQRAQKSIDRCNTGRLLVPESAPWVPGFVARLILFTGEPTAGNDDEPDALVSAVDGGMMGGVSVPRTVGKRRI
jgi:hypothetical protein